MMTANTPIAVQCEWIKIAPILIVFSKKYIFLVCRRILVIVYVCHEMRRAANRCCNSRLKQAYPAQLFPPTALCSLLSLRSTRQHFPAALGGHLNQRITSKRTELRKPRHHLDHRKDTCSLSRNRKRSSASAGNVHSHWATYFLRSAHFSRDRESVVSLMLRVTNNFSECVNVHVQNWQAMRIGCIPLFLFLPSYFGLGLSCSILGCCKSPSPASLSSLVSYVSSCLATIRLIFSIIFILSLPFSNCKHF